MGHRTVADRLKIQGLLRIGLSCALLLMTFGISAKVIRGDWEAPSLRLLGAFEESLAWPDRLMGLGIVTLALTPLLRVLALILLWILEKDWKFVGVAVAVLIVLGLAIQWGGG